MILSNITSHHIVTHSKLTKENPRNGIETRTGKEFPLLTTSQNHINLPLTNTITFDKYERSKTKNPSLALINYQDREDLTQNPRIIKIIWPKLNWRKDSGPKSLSPFQITIHLLREKQEIRINHFPQDGRCDLSPYPINFVDLWIRQNKRVVIKCTAVLFCNQNSSNLWYLVFRNFKLTTRRIWKGTTTKHILTQIHCVDRLVASDNSRPSN